MLPFGPSTAVLSIAQGVTVGVPRPRPFPALDRLRLRGRWWGALPPASVLVVVLGLRAASGAAQGLTYLALFAVPPLAAVALAWVVRGARPALATLVIPLFALAWADRHGLAGQAAALALSALSCVTLGTLLAAVTPASWLKVGIVLMAMTDTALVVSDLLQAPNDVLNAAAPAAGLPRLQEAQFGSAVMGYGDLFVAGVLGALLAAERRTQGRASLLVAALALAFDLLFLVVSELPATVPVAVALVLIELEARRQRGRAPGRGVPDVLLRMEH